MIGDDCYYDNTICEESGLFCANWDNHAYGTYYSCEDCSESADKFITDSYGDYVEYRCDTVINRNQNEKEKENLDLYLECDGVED